MVSKSQSPTFALFLRNLGGGGIERVMTNLAIGLTQKGIKVDLVLLKAEGIFLEQIPNAVRVINLNTSKLDQGRSFKLPTSFQSISSLPKLIRYLRQEKPAAILSAGHYPNEIAILAKHLAQVKTRIIVSEHTSLSLEVEGVEQASASLIPVTARILYPWANNIIAVSKGVAQDLSKVAGIPLKKIEVIYNPVITPDLEHKAQDSVEHPWFDHREAPIILGMGRFAVQKDFPTLLRAFAKVRQVRPARLMMLGSGREGSRLRALAKELNIEEDIAWIGFVNNPFPYLKRADLFVVSSAWEGFGNVLVEAMAVGIPIVSTNCPSGPEEVLDHGKYGKLVPVGDVQAMAEAILQVLSGEIKSVDQAWLEQFTLETVIQKYISILEGKDDLKND